MWSFVTVLLVPERKRLTAPEFKRLFVDRGRSGSVLKSGGVPVERVYKPLFFIPFCARSAPGHRLLAEKASSPWPLSLLRRLMDNALHCSYARVDEHAPIRMG